MAVYQGPIEGKGMTLGATGFWNSSMRPDIFYLVGRDGTFDATRAEIIGGIDGEKKKTKIKSTKFFFFLKKKSVDSLFLILRLDNCKKIAKLVGNDGKFTFEPNSRYLLFVQNFQFRFERKSLRSWQGFLERCSKLAHGTTGTFPNFYSIMQHQFFFVFSS